MQLKKFFPQFPDAINSIGEVFFALGVYAEITFQSIFISFVNPPRWNLIRDQLYQMGVLSLPVVMMTGLSTGLVLAAQSFFQLSNKGLSGATGIMVAKAMMTELGPVLTSFMITGRVGAAMCAELGTMKVTEQIDAIRSMAVNPIRYLLAPRFIAGIVMTPLLTIFSVLLGIFGGYLVAVYYFNMAPVDYFDPMRIYLTPFDFWQGTFKSIVFGLLIVSICCYKGMTTSGGAAGVGQATTSSVVISYTWILFVNFLMTMALNIIHTWIYRW